MRDHSNEGVSNQNRSVILLHFDLRLSMKADLLSYSMEGLVALVTGSTTGIGAAIAKVLASRGCSIILSGLGSPKVIDECLSAVRSTGKDQISVDYLNADVQKPGEIESMCGEALKLHPRGVDILVNNAGVQYVSPVEDFPVDKWNMVTQINLTASFLFIKYLLPQMKKNNWGRIVNIASAHGLVASVNKAAYVASKHGLVGLTKVVALETAKTGITCNAICPGWVLTDLVQKQLDDIMKEKSISFKEAQELLFHQVPSGKCLTAEEVGDFVAFLCSPGSQSIQGSAFTIDGGWTAQ